MGLDYDVPQEEPKVPSQYESKMGILRRELREDALPYFSDDDFAYYLQKHDGDVEEAAYEMLIVKSEDSQVALVGLTTQDTSSYFKRLASRHKTFNTQILGG